MRGIGSKLEHFIAGCGNVLTQLKLEHLRSKCVNLIFLRFVAFCDMLHNMEVLDLAVASIGFLSPKEKRKLRGSLNSLADLEHLTGGQLAGIVGRRPRAFWDGMMCSSEAQKSYSVMCSKGIRSTLFFEEDYPAMLLSIKDYPYALFYLGNLDALKKRCVSVVGTRKPCQLTAQATLDFTRKAASAGWCVVSGLAYGIDSFAHRGALSSGVPSSTVAVLPCGADTVVPHSNRALAANIVKNGGCLLSEYVPGCEAENWRFVHRNRLVAALSSCTLVSHAPVGSGSLITADFAVDYGRDVAFLAAGLSDEAKSTEGNKTKSYRNSDKFLAEGAPVVEGWQDFLALQKEPPGQRIGMTLFNGGDNG